MRKSTISSRHLGESWYLRFHDLMPFRVREILLVSSPYDAFILEEDGRLTARLFEEYSELNLSQAPRITHAPTATRAMELLTERRFDMVLTMVHLQDMDVTAFARQVKEARPRLPVVLLGFTEADLLYNLPSNRDGAIDQVFLWTGDTRILIAIIKLIEDARNLDHDTHNAGVRVIIVVEDAVRRYSSMLSIIYTELLIQAASLIAEGVNDLHKLLRMRARPKILLVQTFEDAMSMYRQYRPYVFTVVSDVHFPKDGELQADAGFELVKLVRSDDPDLPLLLVSAEPELSERAEELGVSHAEKNSASLPRDIRHFLKEGLGFGPFMFRLPDRTEVARARDMYEMEQLLHAVPGESIEFHASRNHFSLWLMARSMFRLATQLRPRTIEEFEGIEGLRQHMIEVLKQARRQEQAGVVTDFSPQQTQADSAFVRVGQGSMGGKARGIAFANALLVRHGMLERFKGLGVRIPRTVVIGTNEFDRFLDENNLAGDAMRVGDDQDVLAAFLDAKLPADLVRDLRVACRKMEGPLAVRSSSLLEDAYLHPFAGVYSTYMLPNNDPDPAVRFDELCQAVKAVYASAYSLEAKVYIAGTPYTVEEEKMGVLIQEIVGREHEDRFYPDFSGVALSYNYYPIGGQRAEEGIAAVALGLGKMVVDGGTALRFSPGTPALMPEYPSPAEVLEYSQREFYALHLGDSRVDYTQGTGISLRLHDLAVAERDGTLAAMGSVYSVPDDAIRDTLTADGPRVVTFNNILKYSSIPLAPALTDLLGIFSKGIGYTVEIEFAVDMGAAPGNGSEGAATGPALYVLQIRPQATQIRGPAVSWDELPAARVLCRSDMSLGHGIINNVFDVVYVKPEVLERVSTKVAALEVGEVNQILAGETRPYLLIGPGRWGSSDPRLGVPVDWSQISGARVIAETSFDHLRVVPSQGSHFFHNITSLEIGYLALSDLDGGPPYDREWLDALPAVWEGEAVRHVNLETPLVIYLDGRLRRSIVLKQG